MKAIVRDGPAPDDKPFPKLMVGNRSGIIVLMVKSCAGTVVGNPASDFPLGTFSSTWTLEYFTDYPGTITLSND